MDHAMRQVIFTRNHLRQTCRMIPSSKDLLFAHSDTTTDQRYGRHNLKPYDSTT